MSIISNLLSGKITFGEANTEIATWFEKLAGGAAPAVLQDLNQAQTDLKQGLSNAIALGDTALGSLLTTATPGIELAVTTFLTAATKGLNAPLAPAEDAGIALGIQAFHTLIDELATKARAGLGSTT